MVVSPALVTEQGINAMLIVLSTDGLDMNDTTISISESAIYHKIPKEYLPFDDIPQLTEEDVRTIAQAVVQEELEVIENGTY